MSPFTGNLDLSRTAHLIVDLQNGFMERGAPVEVPAARDIVGRVNQISRAMRAHGGLNVFLRMMLGPESLQEWPVFYTRLPPGQTARGMSESFSPGAHYAALWPGLEVTAEDVVVEKRRFSAFIPGASALHEMLQRRGIDTLIITGTLTNCCCESTARDAQQMNYRILFISDGTAAQTQTAHDATLENMRVLFGDVLTTDEVLSQITGSKAPARSAAQRA
jgi:ureidoacrylate peracid hydrolase